MQPNRGIVVFSGGSAANNLVDVFTAVRESKNCSLSYIIPISDNGGSSSELIRVFGGPGIGDVRSRLVRLIPSHPPSLERSAIATLFNHRLSSTSSLEAAAEWQAIVSGTADLWHAIPSAKKELIRSFLNLLNLEILKRSRPPTSTFDFTSASVGNLFLTGARLFCGSFESSIYLLGSICGIPDELVRVVPAVNSNFSHHIAAGLANGHVIVGQNSISHPSVHTALENPTAYSPTGTRSRLSLGDPEAEDANLPGSLPTLRKQNIKFSKEHEEDLPARIERIWYINPYGQEISPPANPRVTEAIRDSQAIIYSIGSLYTSIVPSIILRGVGQAIRSSPARHKILILNGSLDREVGPSTAPFTALDFIEAIARAGEESAGRVWSPSGTATATVTPLSEMNQPPQSNNTTPTIIPTDYFHNAAQLPPKSKPHPLLQSRSSNPSNTEISTLNGLLLPGNPSTHNSSSSSPNTLRTSVHSRYVTHLIHLVGEGTPAVDKARLNELGIDCLRLYGRKIDGGVGGGGGGAGAALAAKGMKYDAKALAGAIETILGRKGDAMSRGRSRRNTLEA